jgi:hypothetical protein
MTTDPVARAALLRAWEEQTKAAATRAAETDWSTAAKINPKDLGFRMGPVMTEEEFKAHCQRTGTKPTIVKK